MAPEDRALLIFEITQAIKPPASETILSEEEVRALKLLIKKQEQSIAFRQSIIDKTLTAIVVLLVTAFLGSLGNWFYQHIYKP